MPRFKDVHKGLKLLPIDFDKQLLPGTFEHALCYLVDHELDLSDFHARYRNSVEGAPAYDPAVLLKIVLLAYSRGIISSRQMEAACRDHVLFMAISGDSQPHFTTLAHFVSSMGDLAAKLFAQVLAVCDRQELIGREMFAIDGVKLPSNASKSRSGTRADFIRQAEKMEKAAQAMIERQRQCDKQPEDEAQRAARRLERLQADARQLRAWLNDNPEDRKGAKGRVNLSNRTDNESAKMATSKGVIQGYTGVAAVDEKAQIIVDAQAHGTGSEQALLEPVIEATCCCAALIPITPPMPAITVARHSRAWKRRASLPLSPTMVTVNGMSATLGSSTIQPNLTRSGTRGRNASAATATHRPTSTSIHSRRLASVRRASSYMATAVTV